MPDIEYSSVFACKFEAGKVRPEQSWSLVSDATTTLFDDEAGGDDLDCCYSPSGATIRIVPMDRLGRKQRASASTAQTSPPKWVESLHFHPLLRYPPGHEIRSQGLVCLFEAIAREGVIVALSPDTKFVGGSTWQICFGDNGNTRTTVRRGNRQVSGHGRVCQERSWTSYWISYCQGKTYAGIGSVPGEQCIVILEDAGWSNEGGEPTSETDPIRNVGFGNAGTGDRQAPVPLRVRSVRVSTVPAGLKDKLSGLSADNLQSTQVGDDDLDEETRALMKEYEEELRKARARAAKFGVEYKEPQPDAFLPWSQARRLRANPKAGFVTGIDLGSADEKAKQEARRKRFGAVAPSGPSPDDPNAEPREGGTDNRQRGEATVLDVLQSWDNEELVRNLRTDPPKELWKVPPTDDTPDESRDEFAMETDKPTFSKERIHIFSIDWAAFKQIRTNDIMAYFSIYGPSYVEWLGDLSCNVHFEDQFSAARAIENLSMEIPSPPPSKEETAETEKSIPDFGAMGWRFGNRLLRKVAHDRYGRRGTTARILLRVATSADVLHERPSSWLKPPPGFTTKRVLGPGSDFQPKRSGRDQKRRRGHDSGTPLTQMFGSEPLSLSGGLRAGRAGFSVEEMEAERARKRAKASTDPSAAADGKGED